MEGGGSDSDIMVGLTFLSQEEANDFKLRLEELMSCGLKVVNHAATVAMKLGEPGPLFPRPVDHSEMAAAIYLKGVYAMLRQLLKKAGKTGLPCCDKDLHCLLQSLMVYEDGFEDHFEQDTCMLVSSEKGIMRNFFSSGRRFSELCFTEHMKLKIYKDPLSMSVKGRVQRELVSVPRALREPSSDSEESTEEEEAMQSAGCDEPEQPADIGSGTEDVLPAAIEEVTQLATGAMSTAEWRRALTCATTTEDVRQLLDKADQVTLDRCVFCGTSFIQPRSLKRHLYLGKPACDYLKNTCERLSLEHDHQLGVGCFGSRSQQERTTPTPVSQTPTEPSEPALLIRSEIARLRHKRLLRGDVKDPEYKNLLFDQRHHDTQMSRYQVDLGQLRQLLAIEIVPSSSATSTAYDSKQESEEREANWEKFCQLRETALASAIALKTATPAGKGSDCSYYSRSSSDDELKARYGMYLKEKNAKGTLKPIKAATAKSYLGYLFSAHRPNSFAGHCKKIYGFDFQISSFMFRPDGEHVIIESAFLKSFIMPQNQESGASLANGGLCAVISLLTYFLECSSLCGIDHSSPAVRGNLSEWKCEMQKARQELSSHIGGLNHLSARQSKAKKRRKELANPGEEQRRAEAFDR